MPDTSSLLNRQNTSSEMRDNTSVGQHLQPNTTPTQFITYVPPTKQKPNEVRVEANQHEANTMQSLHTPCIASSTLPASPQMFEIFNTTSAVPDAPLPASGAIRNATENGDLHASDTAGSPECSATEDCTEEDREERRKTWAGRNPTKATIPEPQKKSWKGQNMEVRKICENEQRERCQNMAEELEKVQEHYHQQLRDIRMKYRRSFETIVNYVSYSSRYKKQRAPSLYLARVSAKAEEINKGMLPSDWNSIASVIMS